MRYPVRRRAPRFAGIRVPDFARGWLSGPCDPEDPENWTVVRRFRQDRWVKEGAPWATDWRHLDEHIFGSGETISLEAAATTSTEVSLRAPLRLLDVAAGRRRESRRSVAISSEYRSSVTLDRWVRTMHQVFRTWEVTFTIEANLCCGTREELRALFERTDRLARPRVRPGLVCTFINSRLPGCINCWSKRGPDNLVEMWQEELELRNPKDDQVWDHAVSEWKPVAYG